MVVERILEVVLVVAGLTFPQVVYGVHVLACGVPVDKLAVTGTTFMKTVHGDDGCGNLVKMLEEEEKNT